MDQGSADRIRMRMFNLDSSNLVGCIQVNNECIDQLVGSKRMARNLTGMACAAGLISMDQCLKILCVIEASSLLEENDGLDEFLSPKGTFLGRNIVLCIFNNCKGYPLQFVFI